jgi:hypothetical protein
MNYTNPNLHPLDIEEVNALLYLFLADVIYEYRDHEIKDWLHGLSGEDIETILQKKGNELLQQNPFVVAFAYLKFQVVPTLLIAEKLRLYIQKHPILGDSNEVLNKTKENFTRIFTGKTDYTHRPN